MSFLNQIFDPNAGLGYRPQQPDLGKIQRPDLINVATGQNVGQANQQVQNQLNQQQAFYNAVMGQGGLSNQANVFAQQQALANQLQGVASGTGPNPALAQLNQTTGQNVAAQGALMAGQRGANANVGLLARQIANQGAASQQQSIGQAATLQAQQQLAAMNALQSQQSQMANVAGQQVGQQQTSLAQMQQAALANQQAQQQTLAQQNQAQINAAQAYNAPMTQLEGQYQQADLAQQQNIANAQAGLLGGISSAATSAFLPTPQKKFEGGMIDNYEAGGMVQIPAMQPMESFAPLGPKSKFANYVLGSQPQNFACGGTVNMVSGGPVPGQAQVAGDSIKNDTVPAMVSPGEIVIPRSIAQGDNAPEKAAQFVAAVLGRKGRLL